MASAASTAGITVSGKKISNHSVRKTCISRLLNANVPETYVAQLSGHKNINSLQSYKSPSTTHQHQMSSVLSRMDSVSSSAISTKQARSSMSTNQQYRSVYGTRDPLLSSSADLSAVFTNTSVNSISDCHFQVINYNGPVTVQPPKKRRFIIESDDEIE